MKNIFETVFLMDVQGDLKRKKERKKHFFVKMGARRVGVPKNFKIKPCTVQDVLQLVLIDPLHPALFKVGEQGIVLYCILL